MKVNGLLEGITPDTPRTKFCSRLAGSDCCQQWYLICQYRIGCKIGTMSYQRDQNRYRPHNPAGESHHMILCQVAVLKHHKTLTIEWNIALVAEFLLVAIFNFPLLKT